MNPLKEWRGWLTVDIAKWEDDPMPTRRFQPTPEAHIELIRLKPKYPDAVMQIRETVAELAELMKSASRRIETEPGFFFRFEDDKHDDIDLEVPNLAARLRKEIRFLMELRDNEIPPTTADTITPEQWITLTETARGFGWEVGRKKRPDVTKVRRLIKEGKIIDNGETGHERRVSKASIVDYCKSSGEAWNDVADL